MNINKITIITPPIATSNIDLDLVKLTKYIWKKYFPKEEYGYGLGGEYGYGETFENDVFMMHRYCWCDQGEKCLWCMLNDPKENRNYYKMKKELKDKYGKFFSGWGSAPNFYHKKSGFGCLWYKWIGRGMVYNKDISTKEWKKIFKECIESI